MLKQFNLISATQELIHAHNDFESSQSLKALEISSESSLRIVDAVIYQHVCNSLLQIKNNVFIS